MAAGIDLPAASLGCDDIWLALGEPSIRAGQTDEPNQASLLLHDVLNVLPGVRAQATRSL
jgi:hypothetical protein